MSRSLLVAFSTLVFSCTPGTTSANENTKGVPNPLSLMRQKGCGSCHYIPALHSANGRVGPGLSHYQKRAYIAGVMPNTRENLTRWLVNPQAVSPQTAMPDTQLNQLQAEQIAAFLLQE